MYATKYAKNIVLFLIFCEFFVKSYERLVIWQRKRTKCRGELSKHCGLLIEKWFFIVIRAENDYSSKRGIF